MHNISSSGNYIVNTTEVVRNTVYSSGTFPRIEYRFNFWRKPTYYFLTLIIPGSLLVIISWFAMWTPVPPARTAISVTTLLTNFALRSSAMNMLPASSTISWLEQILTINVVLLFFGTVQTGMAFAAPSMLQITKEMRASWHKAKAERAERTRTDSDLVRDDSAPDINQAMSDTDAEPAEPKVKKVRAKRSSILSVAADGVSLAKRPCSCCEWWLLYGSSATNWPDVIGQILWPLAYIVILILMLDSGWGHGAASACEQDIRVLCGVSLGDFLSTDGKFGH